MDTLDLCSDWLTAHPLVGLLAIGICATLLARSAVRLAWASRR